MSRIMGFLFLDVDVDVNVDAGIAGIAGAAAAKWDRTSCAFHFSILQTIQL